MTLSLRSRSRSPILAIIAFLGLAVGLGSLPASLAQAPRPAAPAHPRAQAAADPTIPALMISDIHFDPFNDPGKVKALVAAPVSGWKAILAAPASPDREQAFSGLQQTCHARGVDTPFSLLQSSIAAMRARQPNAKFMTISGDLLAHAFTCRYSTLFPRPTLAEYQAFVVKTLGFVIAELRAAFPEMPIYTSLGNNDSGCGDYQLDAEGSFLAETGKILAEALPPLQRAEVLRQFGEGGYYSVTMAEPMQATRLIVVNDVFLSPKFTTCSGKPDVTAANREMAWLEQELKQAQAAGQKVWVIGHIPTGIDPYSTAAKFRNICAGQAPVMFLNSDKLADELVQHAGVIRLAIFAHTHMDEVRLLGPLAAAPDAEAARSVAVKMVSSISPVDGNNPSFTVARVNPTTAVLENYKVIAASNQTGIATRWTTEYDFGQTYHLAQFSPSTVGELIGRFQADRSVATPESQAYIVDYFVGGGARELSPFWPQYTCALNNYTAKAYAACMCSTAK